MAERTSSRHTPVITPVTGVRLSCIRVSSSTGKRITAPEIRKVSISKLKKISPLSTVASAVSSIRSHRAARQGSHRFFRSMLHTLSRRSLSSTGLL